MPVNFASCCLSVSFFCCCSTWNSLLALAVLLDCSESCCAIFQASSASWVGSCVSTLKGTSNFLKSEQFIMLLGTSYKLYVLVLRFAVVCFLPAKNYARSSHICSTCQVALRRTSVRDGREPLEEVDSLATILDRLTKKSDTQGLPE